MISSAQGGDPIEQIILFNTALMYFLLLPAIIPLAIAVYSIVGEKEQTTLEPLLATPVSDVELFLGKALASVRFISLVNIGEGYLMSHGNIFQQNEAIVERGAFGKSFRMEDYAHIVYFCGFDEHVFFGFE